VNLLLSQKSINQRLLGSFPQQRAFVEDESPFICVFCTRRAAKSYSAALKAIRTAQRFKRCSVAIIGLTHATVKNTFWLSIIKDIAERYRVSLRFNESNLVATLNNGSQIHLVGMDASDAQKKKLLGQKFAFGHRG